MSVQMTELKAGALMSGAMRMGAVMSGADETLVDLLAGIGKDLGCIAQLVNDMQDVLPRYPDRRRCRERRPTGAQDRPAPAQAHPADCFRPPRRLP